jgi:hypothetical protein
MSERLATEQEYITGRMGVKIPAIDQYIGKNSWGDFPDGHSVSSFINDILEINGVEPTESEHVPRELVIPATDNKPMIIIRGTHRKTQILTAPETPGSFVEVLGYHGDRQHWSSEYDFTERYYRYYVGQTYFMGKELGISHTEVREHERTLFKRDSQIDIYRRGKEFMGQHYQASLKEALEETVKLLS